MDIIFKGRRTDVQDRFRRHASAKLTKIEKLDRRAIRVDVEVSQERNPRQSGRRERVELTIRSRGPVIRAEAAADDRYIALDRALAKLEARLRRSGERRKAKRAPLASGVRGLWAVYGLDSEAATVNTAGLQAVGPAVSPEPPGAWPGEDMGMDDLIPIQMEGDGPVVVREKHHPAMPMTIDQALLEMELVGHDFYLFRDQESGHPSVVYRRHGYQYGLIRLIEEASAQAAGGPGAWA